jgi:hypothetical protein
VVQRSHNQDPVLPRESQHHSVVEALPVEIRIGVSPP